MLNSMQHWVEKDKAFYPAPENYWCQVCGQIGNCGIEPRFGYVVCECCSTLAPVNIPTKPTNYPAL